MEYHAYICLFRVWSGILIDFDKLFFKVSIKDFKKKVLIRFSEVIIPRRHEKKALYLFSNI